MEQDDVQQYVRNFLCLLEFATFDCSTESDVFTEIEDRSKSDHAEFCAHQFSSSISFLLTSSLVRT